jgi:ubiquinone/menaquinone biosynthesis C-methylase UbiE
MAKSPDYSRIADGYDRRYEANPLEPVAEALRSLVVETGAGRVLEVGCGTGRWLAELADLCDEACGIDPSTAMLQRARERCPGLRLCEGKAEALPFADASLDLVYCVNAIHHFQDPRAFVSEASRVLAGGGMLAVVGSDPHARRESWYIYRFFEGTYERDVERFPRRADVRRWMAAAGFDHVGQRPVAHIVDHLRGRAVFDSPFLQKDACSQLALLTDEAYQTGLRRMEAAIADADARGEEIVFPTDICLTMLTGRKAG